LQPHEFAAGSLLAALLSSAPLAASAPLAPVDTTAVANPAINMDAYLKVAREAADWRAGHRVDEAEFIRMSREEGTVILDTRSEGAYRMLHVKGAIHLDFSDIAVDTLKTLLPHHGTRILIYCNNNFFNAELAFPTKRIDASLNLSTYIALYSYGYRNLYELAPLTNIRRSKLEFEGTELARTLRGPQ